MWRSQVLPGYPHCSAGAYVCLTSTTIHTLNHNRAIFSFQDSLLFQGHLQYMYYHTADDCIIITLCLLYKSPHSSLLQGTSVVSPIVTVLVLALLPFLYASSSPSLLHNNCQLFFLAMCLPFVKTVIIMVVGTSCDLSI